MKIDKFWEEKEKEIQGKIIHKYLAQYLNGYKNFFGPLLGIFFFTKQAIYFQTFPKKNWLSSIWQTETKNLGESSLNFCIPWDGIIKITFPEEKSKIKKFFSGPGNLVTLDYVSENESFSLKLLFNDDIDILKESSSSLRINK
jgi:hypothetical protein